MNPAGPHRLWVLSPGFLWPRHLARVLASAGWRVTILPFPRPDAIGVWGRKPASRRGLWLAGITGLPVVTVEDAFLRSVQPGGAEPAAGVLIDDLGVHYDAARASRIEVILNDARLFTPDLKARARHGMAALKAAGLSKYNPLPRGSGVLPEAGFVLVADQVRGDASVTLGGFGEADFLRMLGQARAENPGRPILVRRHPDRRRRGYLDGAGVGVLEDGLNIHDVLERASGVYCLSSQVGFEAIMAGHRPVVFGTPFYAGWGLSDDRQSFARRQRRASREELFAAAMILAPHWHDPVRGRACGFEAAVASLAVRAQAAWRQPGVGVVLGAAGWKRGFLRRFLGPVGFRRDAGAAIAAARSEGGALAVWASKEGPGLAGDCARAGVELVRVEDGFVRSRGLGAALNVPSSLVLDRSGIYYDPARPSDLEGLIAASSMLPEEELQRAARLRGMIVEAGVSKYNTGVPFVAAVPSDRRVIFVPGQVEDDASVRLGCGDIRTNAALLARVRAENPDAFILYKPHPDVLAGLREGALPALATGLADMIAGDVAVSDLMAVADEVWTMTSLTGFEALLREKPVTVLGMPFYAGWGLTRDLGPLCARRKGPVALDGLVHAALIGYPRYRDPESGLPATPEQIVERLALGGPVASDRGTAVLRLWRKLRLWAGSV